MVAPNTQDEIKVLLAKPGVHLIKIIVTLIEHVEHVTAMNQHVSTQAAKLGLFPMGVADDGELHALAPEDLPKQRCVGRRERSELTVRVTPSIQRPELKRYKCMSCLAMQFSGMLLHPFIDFPDSGSGGLLLNLFDQVALECISCLALNDQIGRAGK